MDIQPEMECNRFHGVVVSSYSVDESERMPRLGRGRSCGSAHLGNPSRACGSTTPPGSTL